LCASENAEEVEAGEGVQHGAEGNDQPEASGDQRQKGQAGQAEGDAVLAA